MPMSPYMQRLRRAVGTDLVLVPSVAALVRDARGRILLVRSAETQRWGLPAGAVEPGESPQEAVAREVFEETGLRVVEARLVDAVGGAGFRQTYPSGDRVEFTVCVYACTVEGTDPAALDGETDAFLWAEPEDVSGRLSLPYPPHLFAR